MQHAMMPGLEDFREMMENGSLFLYKQTELFMVDQ
jgi:hypothetical protein